MSSSKGRWITAAFVVVGIAISVFRSCDSSAPTLPSNVKLPSPYSASVPGVPTLTPSEGASARYDADLRTLHSVAVDGSTVDSESTVQDSSVLADSSTHYYAVSSQLVTDSFQVEGGARFESGDSVSARVCFPGPTFDLQLFPGFTPKLPTPGNLPLINPFKARYNAFIGTGTRSLISIGLGADLDILDQVRLSGAAAVRILPLSADAEVRAHYLF